MLDVIQPTFTCKLKAFGVKQRLKIEVIDFLSINGRIQNITCFVNAKFLHYEVQLLNNNVIYTVINTIVCQHIIGLHLILLSDTVHTTDSLFQSHWVPRKVVIDDDMAELHVQRFSSRICCHQHISFIAEMNQSVVAFFHRHGAIDLLTFQALFFQYTNQEILCPPKLSKYQDFVVRSYTTAAQGVYFLYQCCCFSIGFRIPTLLCFLNEFLQHFYFGL